MKNKRKPIVLSILLLIISLTGCTNPKVTHNHIEQSVEIENVTGYAWECENHWVWHSMDLLNSDIRGMYIELSSEFRDTVSFLVSRTVEDEQQNVFISFEIDDIDAYAEIMRHLYELFDIQIEHVTYTDGCTTKGLN